MRVLLVDGSELVTRAMTRGLAIYGVECESAHSCSQAIRVLQTRESPFDVVVSSRRLTDGSGMELVAWIRRHQPARPILIFATDVDVTLPPQPDAWLETPASSDAVYQVLCRLIGRTACRP